MYQMHGTVKAESSTDSACYCHDTLIQNTIKRCNNETTF